MELGEIIKKLLYHNNFVILPGYGAFVARYKPAEIDFQAKKISPPTKYIYFNETLKEDDGMLIGYLCESMGITRDRAEESIEKYINTIESSLAKGENALIDELGFLTLDMKKNKVFKDKKEENLLLESFGLPIVEFSPEDTSEKQQVPAKKVTRQKTKAEKPQKRSYLVPLIFVSLVLLSLGYLGFEFGFFDPFFSTENETKTFDYSIKKPIVLGPVDSTENNINEQELVKVEIEQATQRHNALSPVTEKKVATELKPVVKEKTAYYIIAASYGTKVQAEEALPEFNRQGFNAKVVTFDNKFRIALKQLTSRDEAVTELEKIRAATLFKDAWLLTR